MYAMAISGAIADSAWNCVAFLLDYIAVQVRQTAMETIHSNLKRRSFCRSTVKCLVYLFRDTTLMPNIHGLMPLVALLFTPYAEMRYKRTLFVYVLSANHLICEYSTISCLFSTYCLHAERKLIYPSIYRKDRNIWLPYYMKFSRHVNFAFLSETHFISLSMLFNVSLNLIV